MAFGFLVAACGDASEVLNEQLLEGIEGVENVEINEEDGTFEITVEEDGETITIGSGDIPEGLTVPVADGGEVVASTSGDRGISVSLTYPGDRFDDLVATYQSWADGSGLDVQKTETTYESEGNELRNVAWSTGDGSVYVALAGCVGMESGEYDSACVNIYEQP
jgi:hypothetical protein